MASALHQSHTVIGKNLTIKGIRNKMVSHHWFCVALFVPPTATLQGRPCNQWGQSV